jgi:transposase, IS5 family
VGATTVQARPARLPAEEKAVIRRGGTPDGWSPARRAQIGRDARWTLERGRKRPPAEDGGSKRQAAGIAAPVFGYKDHLGVDRAHGPIRTWTVTGAAAHDGGQLGATLDPTNTASGVWAGTAYRSAAGIDLLARRGRVGHLRRPTRRVAGRPMPRHLARGNASRGGVRAAVEHAFAARKRRLGPPVRTVGTARPGQGQDRAGQPRPRPDPLRLARGQRLGHVASGRDQAGRRRNSPSPMGRATGPRPAPSSGFAPIGCPKSA